MVFPMFLYFGILTPCTRDYPIEPAMLHAIGLSLGLADLSSASATDLTLVGNGEICNADTHLFDASRVSVSSFEPFASAEKGTCDPNADWWTCDNRYASVMLPLAPGHTQTKLTQDDLDALNVLYPSSCNSTNRISQPLQVGTANWYAGWTAMMTFTLPLALLACLLPLTAVFAAYLRKKYMPEAPDDKYEETAKALGRTMSVTAKRTSTKMATLVRQNSASAEPQELGGWC